MTLKRKRVYHGAKTILNGKSVEEWIDCKCKFCVKGMPHSHKENHGWYGITGRTTKPESLKVEDRIYVEACDICGHSREES